MTLDLSAQTTVLQALLQVPALASVLRARRTACVGCCMARFCTLWEAAEAYCLPWDQFLEDLKASVCESARDSGGNYNV